MAEVLLARLDDVTAAAIGAATDGSNTGSAGVGVFKQKAGTILEFYKINPLSSRFSVALDGTNKIDVDVVEAQILLQNLGGALSVGQQNAISINNLTGDVATAQIENLAVTFAKIQNIATDRLLGRDTAGSGSVEELTVGGNLEFTGAGGIQRGALTGDVTAGAGSGATTIANNAVSDAKLRDSAAVSVIGRSANSTGDPADIAAAANDRMLRRTGDTINFGQLTAGMVPNATITKAMIENVAADRLLGRGNGGGAGAPQEIALGTGLSMTGTTLNAAASIGPTLIHGPITVSNQATWDFDSGDLAAAWDGTYDMIDYIITNIVPATDGVGLWLRFSEDAGATFKAAAGDYSTSGYTSFSDSAGLNVEDNVGTAQIDLTDETTNSAQGMSNAAGEIGNLTLRFFEPDRASVEKMIEAVHHYKGEGAATRIRTHITGYYLDSQNAINGLRILASSGNISFRVSVYGWKIA